VRELCGGKGHLSGHFPLIGRDALEWLKQQAKDGDVLLAHQDDGVVWGKAREDRDWVTSDAVLSTSPALEGRSFMVSPSL
jgi:hypothetical protein